MGGVFVVSPQEWGWSVSVRETGEVMFFQDGDQARQSALAMAETTKRLGGVGTVEVRDHAGQFVGFWTDGRYELVRPDVDDRVGA